MTMDPKIFIITVAGDLHSLVVEQALLKKGIEVCRFDTSCFALSNSCSYLFDYNQKVFETSISSIFEPSTIWFHRLHKPFIASDIHKDDVDIAKSDTQLYLNSYLKSISSVGRWVNPLEGSRNANDKLLQLSEASKIGLKFPRTLISNNGEQIRSFLEDVQNSIYKPLQMACWNDSVLYTSIVKISDLPDDHIIQSTPGIYQEKISVKYELRVVAFGSFFLPIRIIKNPDHQDVVDWRTIPKETISTEIVAIPKNLESKLFELMKRLGIVFGSFDILVDDQDEYYFLEVNHQGQFLWPELCNPELPLLDYFIDFLSDGTHKFEYHKKPSRLALHDFLHCEAFENKLMHEKKQFLDKKIICESRIQ